TPLRFDEGQPHLLRLASPIVDNSQVELRVCAMIFSGDKSLCKDCWWLLVDEPRCEEGDATCTHSDDQVNKH
ncbi:hypothetical protein A2U01_0025582, partial [Trifolium medium]|nr:hypothetical protein [Trifolium medium]